MTADARCARLRFGVYEIDARTGEVWREGIAVHLPPQPFKVLWLLASRAGDVVTREEIRQELWGTDTFVDFDGSLNFCINQIRKVLRDSAESPRFIHTLPRRGYRFIAGVETIAAPGSETAERSVDATVPAPAARPDPEDNGGGGVPRARASHLYEVVRDPEAEARRWRPSGGPSGGRLATSPIALADEPAAERQESPSTRPAAPVARPESVLASQEPSPPVSPPPLPPLPALPPPRRALRRAMLGLAVAAAGLAALGVAALKRAGHAEPVYERLTFRRGTVYSARFEPGGDVAYTASWDGGDRRGYVARPGETVARPMELPDRSYVQSALGSGDLAVILDTGSDPVLALAPPFGGKPRELASGVTGADVSADGSVVALVRSGPEDRIELPPGHEIYHVPAKINGLRLSPSGDRVAFLEHAIPLDDRGEVVTVDRAGRRTVLSRDWASLEGLAWSPDGREVWFTGARVGADSTLNSVSLSGAERVVVRGPGRLVLHDIRADGAVLLERNTRRMELHGEFRDGAEERDLSWLDLSYVTDLSADGTKVVFSESGEGGGAGYGVFLRGTDGSPPVRLGEGRAMTLSPDGQWVLTIPLFGPPRVLALPTGAGEARTLATGLTRHTGARWFPDSRSVLFTAAEAGQPLRVFAQDLEGGPARPLTGEISMAPAVIAPDGRRVLARTPGPSGRWQLYPADRASAPGPPAAAPLDAKDRPISFTVDGRGVFVVPAWTSGPVLIEKVDLATGRRLRWREIKTQDGAGGAYVGPVVITPDGHSDAYSVHRNLSELYLVRGLS
jgi:DNA-binding winged helix-turn-helix (wHTH) protein/dipeptidyl aminopeptidase/acylaminoacyl peptidase